MLMHVLALIMYIHTGYAYTPHHIAYTKCVLHCPSKDLRPSAEQYTEYLFKPRYLFLIPYNFLTLQYRANSLLLFE